MQVKLLLQLFILKNFKIEYRTSLIIKKLNKDYFLHVTKLSDNIEGQIIFKKFIKNI